MLPRFGHSVAITRYIRIPSISLMMSPLPKSVRKSCLRTKHENSLMKRIADTSGLTGKEMRLWRCLLF